MTNKYVARVKSLYYNSDLAFDRFGCLADAIKTSLLTFLKQQKCKIDDRLLFVDLIYYIYLYSQNALYSEFDFLIYERLRKNHRKRGFFIW